MKHRYALSKLRTSTHTLKIETGRHQGVPRENRLCTVCDIIEDEFHFLDNCIKYNDARNKLLTDVLIKNPKWSFLKPSQLFIINELQDHLGRYVFECLK